MISKKNICFFFCIFQRTKISVKFTRVRAEMLCCFSAFLSKILSIYTAREIMRAKHTCSHPIEAAKNSRGKKKKIYVYISPSQSKIDIAASYCDRREIPSSTKAGNLRGSPVIHWRNFGECGFAFEKKFAMQNSRFTIENRANTLVECPKAHKSAQIARYICPDLSPFIEIERGEGEGGEMGHRIRASINSAQKRKPGTSATPFAEHWLGLLMQFFYPSIPRTFFLAFRWKKKKKLRTTTYKSGCPSNRIDSDRQQTSGGGRGWRRGLMPTEVAKDFREGKPLNVLLVLRLRS